MLLILISLVEKAETNGMEVHIDLGNVSQIINENDIRARVRNIRRFLNMTEARLNRLHVQTLF